MVTSTASSPAPPLRHRLLLLLLLCSEVPDTVQRLFVGCGIWGAGALWPPRHCPPHHQHHHPLYLLPRRAHSHFAPAGLPPPPVPNTRLWGGWRRRRPLLHARPPPGPPLPPPRPVPVLLRLRVHANATRPNALELCFHRNATVGPCKCAASQWQKMPKSGLWAQAISPYDHRVLDFRMPADPSRSIVVSTEEEFLLHRVVFLVLGMVLMAVAHMLSKSVVFYYGGAMTIGIFLVILIILFQVETVTAICCSCFLIRCIVIVHKRKISIAKARGDMSLAVDYSQKVFGIIYGGSRCLERTC